MVEDPNYGTVWGKMFIRGEITEAEKMAADWFSELHAQYLKAIYSPKPSPKNARLDGLSGGAPDVPDDWAKAKRAEWADVEAILRRRCRRSEITAIKGMCFEDIEQRPEWVRPGLRVLAEIRVDGRAKAA